MRPYEISREKIMIYLDESNRSCKRPHCDRVQQRTKLPDDDITQDPQHR